MWLTVKQLALYLNLKEKTIYHLVNQMLIPHYRIGKIIRFKKVEIDLWMASKKVKSFDEHVDIVKRSFYTTLEGKPDHLKKEVG